MAPLEPTRRSAGDFPFALGLRVRFYETDAMAVVHHAAYLGYLEAARVEYLRALGRPYAAIRAGGHDIAVVAVQVAYHAPLRFDDEFQVHAGIAHARRSTFAVEYLVERDGQSVLTGFTRHAMLDSRSGRPVRLPEWLRTPAPLPGAGRPDVS